MKGGILNNMIATLPQLQDSVEFILSNWPETMRIFIDQKTDCVGCLLVRFCSVRDVASIYDLDTEKFVAELQLVAQNRMSKGGNHEIVH